jgi:hypothetical protein
VVAIAPPLETREIPLVVAVVETQIKSPLLVEASDQEGA